MKTNVKRKTLALAVAAVSMLGYAAAGSAQERGRSGLVLEEIVVTATKQEETISNVGASIVAVNSEQIDNLGFRSMSSLVTSMPNVNVQEGSTGTKLTVRGIGTPPTGGASSSVATFIDGVYQGNSSQTNNILVDMERVEILRGPQGTLFGKNSIAGVFNLITSRPTQEFEGLIDLRGGNNDSHEGTLMVSGGLTDSISGRLTVHKHHSGDYLENTLNSGGAGGADKELYRLSLNWDISANTSLWVKYQHDHFKRNAALIQLIALDPIDAAHLASVDPGLLARTDTKLNDKYAAGLGNYYGQDTGLNKDTVLNSSRDTFAAILNHSFANEYELTATAGYDRNDFRNRGNTSQSYSEQTIYLDTDSIFETKNLELRLSSPTEDRVRFTVGAYAEQSKYGIDKGHGYLNFNGPLQPGLPPLATMINMIAGGFYPPGALAPDAALASALIVDIGRPYGFNETTSLAGYGQITVDFTDEWSLTAGLRYAEDKITQKKTFYNRQDLNGNPLFSAASFAGIAPIPGIGLEETYAGITAGILGSFIGYPGNPDWKETHKDRAVLPAAKLEFRPNPDSLYYLSVQSGYKNGGFSTDGLAYPSPFEKEKSLAYELGGKVSVFNGRGQVSGSLFRTDFKDLQVAAIDPSSGGVLFTNAAEAYSQGFELEGRWKVAESLVAGLRYAFLDAEYKSFDNAPLSVSQAIAVQNGLSTATTQDLGGERLGNAPRNSGSFSLDYVQPFTDALNFQANLLVSVTDDTFTDLGNSDELKASSATLVDLRLAIVDTVNLWTVALIGQNLTDDRGQISGTTASLLHKGTYFGTIRPPASYWLQLEKRF